jgi:hypothetical protein
MPRLRNENEMGSEPEFGEVEIEVWVMRQSGCHARRRQAGEKV